MSEEHGSKKTASVALASIIRRLLDGSEELIIVIAVALLVIHRYTLGQFREAYEN